MWIIDRYLLRHYLQTFAICFLSLMGLWIVIEVSSHLQEFIRCGEKSGGILQFILYTYGYKSFLFFDWTSGFIALVSAMFTASWIQRHNEMTALMAAGIARYRVVLPIIAATIAIGLLSVVNREVALPRFINEVARKPKDPLGDQPQELKSRSDNQTDVVLCGKSTLIGDRSIESPAFIMPARSELSDYGAQLKAERAYYRPPQGDRPGGYLFEGVSEPKNLDTRPSLMLDGQAVLITPCDADWLKPGQCFLRSDLNFEQLALGPDYKNYASIAQLIAGLKNPSVAYGADVRVAIHARIVRPLLDITLLFLGLPLVVGRGNRNVFVAMGICMALSAAFMLVVYVFQELGGNYIWIPPALGAWGPLMIFGPLAVWLSEAMWK